jgi:hypothetical protein
MWRFTRSSGITEGFHNETISKPAYGEVRARLMVVAAASGDRQAARSLASGPTKENLLSFKHQSSGGNNRKHGVQG